VTGRANELRGLRMMVFAVVPSAMAVTSCATEPTLDGVVEVASSPYAGCARTASGVLVRSLVRAGCTKGRRGGGAERAIRRRDRRDADRGLAYRLRARE